MAEQTCRLDHNHRHEQSTTCYHDGGCRCRPCTDNMSTRARNRYRLRAYGRLEEARLSPVGTIRRYQGLQLLGWRAEDISALCGYAAPEPLKRLLNNKYVSPVTRDKVAKACDELVRRGRGPSQITADRAKKKGWVSVLAYDNIDDPNETPTGVERERELRGEELTNEIEWLIQGGMTAHDIAKTLGKTMEALEHHAWRWGRNDLASYLREKSVA